MSIGTGILISLLSAAFAEKDNFAQSKNDPINHDETPKHSFIGIGIRFIIRYVKSSYRDDPFRTFLELCLVFFIVWYISRNKYKMNQTDIVLSEKDIDELISEWKPDPLSLELTNEEKEVLENVPVIDGPNGVVVNLIDGSKVVNFTCFDFLGFQTNSDIKNKAVSILRDYGVGACGPTGFYGTLDVHMELESTIKTFMNAEGAILYSQGMATIVSIIPCFSKRNDIIIADEKCNFMIQQGINLSRSKVFWYKHNDMDDLERVMIKTNDIVSKVKGPLPRKFVITEGLFSDTGNIVPLDTVMDLKNKYKYRIILDDSLAIGTLGPRGAGTTDLFGISPKKIDLLLGSLWQVFGAAGGFCCASKELISHQRLSGAGYVFSASMPAILAVTADDNIKRLEIDYPVLLPKLHKNVSLFRKTISRIKDIIVEGDPLSPIIHIRLSNDIIKNYIRITKGQDVETWSRQEENHILIGIVSEMRKGGVLVSQAIYVDEQEHSSHKPSIKALITVSHTTEHFDSFCELLEESISRFH
ncbi:Serine palmitoyltransferase 1 [Smittium mucronatum]|uniref:serine C-palmitoyltransferase n=1 Tax=Smittium mucronatum TaxID=133383 RepID=A0A1R0GL34_9FUNG|nr:Serine palmitoyltransferase 1 [Smittium mucronatum]